MEIWKDIVGYEGLYQISNYGNVRSLNYHRENRIHILKQIVDYTGYLFVCLSKNKKRKQFKIHRLVADAFLDNPNNLPCINHKDENKENNNVSNLEWCNHKYNNVYGTRIKRVSEKTTNGKLSKPVLQYDLEGNFIAEYPSSHEVQRQFGYDYSSISKCCRGYRSKTAYGYIWKYKD